MENPTKVLPRVKMEDMGLYIKTICHDYKAKDAEEIASLITEHFGVKCEEVDVLHYEGLHIVWEDYERMSRDVEYNANNLETWK